MISRLDFGLPAGPTQEKFQGRQVGVGKAWGRVDDIYDNRFYK